MMVDELGQCSPPPEKDLHWEVGVPAELPYTIAAAPFKRNVFLDADTVPCFDLATLYTQLRATESRGLLDLYDVLFVPARESVPRAPARLASWARAPAWVESNGGVIFWRRTPETARLFHRWLASYCRGGDDLAHFNGGDQHILSREVLSAVQRDRLLVYHLLPIWNYRSWRRHFSNTQECCSSASVSEELRPLPIYIDHGCRKPRDYVKRTGNASWFLGEGG